MTLELAPFTFKRDVYENFDFFFCPVGSQKETTAWIQDESGEGLKTARGVRAALDFCNQYRKDHNKNIEILWDHASPIYWRNREANRLKYGAYKRLPISTMLHLQKLNAELISLHFLHISQDGEHVAYTPDHKSGVLDRQIRTTFGRYLTKFFSNVMQPHEIRDFAANLTSESYTLKIGEDRKDFCFAFNDQDVKAPSSNFCSCMSQDKSYYMLPCHPAEVYAAGDLQVAYICNPKNPAQVVARTIIHKARETFTTIYAAAPELHEILKGFLVAKGLRQHISLEGASLLKIPYNGRHVMPYIDGDCDKIEHSDCGEYFQITSSYRHLACANSTSGMIDIAEEEQEETYFCENCEDDCTGDDSEEVVTSMRYRRTIHSTWCPHCVNRDAFFCEVTQVWYSSKDFTRVEGTRRNSITRTICLEANEEEIFFCEYSEEYYWASHFSTVEVETSYGAQTWCREETQDARFYCQAMEKCFSHDDFTAANVEIETENGVWESQLWCVEETEDCFFFCEFTHKNYASEFFTEITVRRLNGREEIWCAEVTVGVACFFCEYMDENLENAFKLPVNSLADLAIL
jgi:hypothetical protein